MTQAFKTTRRIVALLAIVIVVGCFIIYLNAIHIAERLAERTLPAATVKIGSLHLWWGSAQAGDIVISERGGAPVVRLDVLRVRFTLGGLYRNRIDGLLLDHPLISLSQNADNQWNFQRVMPGPSGRVVEIGELSIHAGQVVLADNLFATGFAPLSFTLSARGINTSRLDEMSGDGSAQLPECDVRLHDHPITVHGVRGELKLKLGKSAGGLFGGEGQVSVAEVRYKDVLVESIAGTLQVSDRAIQATNMTAQFYDSPVTGFWALHLNAQPIWYNVGLELKQVDMEKLSAAIVPDQFRVKGASYLYLEAVGNLTNPVTWASLKFKTEGAGTVYIKNLPALLAASSLPADKQQLFLLAFDRGEVLPYKSAWLNADIQQRNLTVATYFERAARWFMELEVKPPPFEIPIAVLKEKGWLP